MRERRQIARRASGALARNPGMDSVFEQGRERLDELEADAGMAAGERRDLGQDHEPHDLVPEFVAHPGGVRADEVFLQLAEFRVPDPDVDQAPESGVHSVHRAAGRDGGVNRPGGGGDALPGGLGERDGHRAPPGRAQGRERDGARPDLDPHGATSGTIGSRRRCSRAQVMASS